MTKEQKLEILSNNIREKLPHLMKIEEGQIFNSEYYGKITCIKSVHFSEGKYNIVGFDKDKQIRDCYYPRDLKLIGHEIKLNDVLSWFIKIDKRYSCEFKDRNFYVYYSNGDFIYYTWNLENQYLKDQSVELIDFLYSLIEK